MYKHYWKKRCRNLRNVCEQICFDCKREENHLYTVPSPMNQFLKNLHLQQNYRFPETVSDSEDDQVVDTNNKRVKV